MLTRGQMGIADREYHRERQPGGGGFLASIPPVTRWLLIANLAVFFLDRLILPLLIPGYWVREPVIADGQIIQEPPPPMVAWGAFRVGSAVYQGRIWEFFTFQFLHGSLGHILFNSIGLFFFGPFMERWMGARKFLAFYLLCGVGGALAYTLLVIANVFPDGGMVGASAGIYGILIGVAVLAPALRVRLLIPPIELSMRQLAIALLVLASAMVIGGYFAPGVSLFWNAGGEAGHLGGAIAGFLLLRFPALLGWVDRPAAEPKRRPRRENGAKLRPRARFRSDDEVDRILDKISAHGFQSLDESEKEILRRASQNPSNEP